MVKLKVVSDAAKFSSGLIGLTPEQAASRLQALKPVGAGPGFIVYEVLNTICFKRGEVIHCEVDQAPRGLEMLE